MKSEDEKLERELTGWTASSDPAFSGEGGEGPPDEDLGKTSLLGMILVPMILVLSAVGIFMAVGFLTYDRRSLDEIKVQLKSPVPQERWMAARLLVQREYANPELVPVLQEILDSPPEEQKIELFQEFRDLLKVDEERTVNLRWFAAKALASIRSPQVVSILKDLTRDEDTGVRFFAVSGLGNLNKSEPARWIQVALEQGVLTRLIDVLEEDEDEAVRMAATLSIGFIGGNAIILRNQIERAGDGLLDVDPLAKMKPAIEGAAGDLERGRLGLIAALEGDESDDVRANAAMALALLGDESGRALLMEKLASGDPQVRSSVRTALAQLEALKN